MPHTSDGKRHEMAEVWFAKDATGATAPKLDELLAVAHTDLVAGLPAAAPVPAGPSGPASHHRSLDDELLRQQNQLL